ncbi:hypothetical protein BDR26DRAFT_874692 [Obelidium mucronatum]|nr:hypothetical protein BDR26DRAFT_874692 [Obelidium mucronatum]
MASQVTVELEGSFPSKKTVIKTTPAMPLNDVLKSAIDKLGNPNSVYVLKHGKATLDLSLSVRFANLPAGAKLVLVPSSTTAKPSTPQTSVPSQSKQPTNSSVSSTPTDPQLTAAPSLPTTTPTTQPLLITIALQVQEGPRIIKKFPPSTTLWSLLKTLESQDPTLTLTKNQQPPPITPPSSTLPKPLQAISEASKKLSQSQKPLVYAFPLLILSNKEYGTFKSLKETTLEGAGLRGGGNALVRLLWRLDPDVSLEDVRAEVDAEWVGVDGVKDFVPAAAAAVSQPASKKATAAASAVVAKKETPAGVGEGEGKVEDYSVELENGEFDRGIKVFSAPPADVDGPMNIQLPDTFFQLSSTELKLAYISSKNKAKQIQDGAPLMTKAMRDREEELKLKKYPKTMIRVRFPDRVTVQAAFLSTEPVSAIYTLISDTLATPTRKYTLYITPPLQDLASKKDQTFWKAGLAPATLVYFKWDDNEHQHSNAGAAYLNEAYLSKMEELPVPPVAEVAAELGAGTEVEDVEMDEPASNSSGSGSASIPASREYRSSDSVPERKVPKWFKLSKK